MIVLLVIRHEVVNDFVSFLDSGAIKQSSMIWIRVLSFNIEAVNISFTYISLFHAPGPYVVTFLVAWSVMQVLLLLCYLVWGRKPLERTICRLWVGILVSFHALVLDHSTSTRWLSSSANIWHCLPSRLIILGVGSKIRPYLRNPISIILFMLVHHSVLLLEIHCVVTRGWSSRAISFSPTCCQQWHLIVLTFLRTRCRKSVLINLFVWLNHRARLSLQTWIVSVLTVVLQRRLLSSFLILLLFICYFFGVLLVKELQGVFFLW